MCVKLSLSGGASGGDNAVAMSAAGPTDSLQNWTTIRNVGSSIVYVMKGDGSTTPTNTQVIANGMPIAAVPALQPITSGGVMDIYDRTGNLAPAQIFFAVAGGAAGEVRIWW